ncbi:MAG: hypothetical protein RLZZ210_694 [Pseudomonadota bacterium]|jgi:predicted alpha/beta hydrolase family esterase
MISNIKAFLLAGFQNSLEGHWQTIWEQNYNFERIQQADWDNPVCDDWVEQLQKGIISYVNNTIINQQSQKPIVLIGHSLGCLTIVEWAKKYSNIPIAGALLVAVPQPSSTAFPQQAQGFSNISMQKLPFKSTVVASTNDKYAQIEFAESCANAWGSEFINIGNFGHINADSGLGLWNNGIEYINNILYK